MSKIKKFHIGDILSVTTGYLVSPSHMDGLYDILNYMAGDTLFTHQLPRASSECTPFLIDKFPELKGVDASKVNEANWKEWLAEQEKKFGEFLGIEPIPKNYHETKNPIEEAQEMMGRAK